MSPCCLLCFIEKVTLDMHAVDLVADLRAEIAVWWEAKIGQSSECATMLGSLLGSPVIGPQGPAHLRLISMGQEISQELDERSLAELGFKDMQLVFASLGSGPARGGLGQLKQPSFLPSLPQKSSVCPLFHAVLAKIATLPLRQHHWGFS
jgi:ubiquitin carboxyl-terminal hydrolase 34